MEQPELQQTQSSTSKQVNGTAAPLSNGSHSQVVSTSTTTRVHGQKESANLKVVATGKSEASATKAAAVSHQRVVQPDGAIVTSGQSSKMRTVKYAVEASSVQEKIIR